MSTLSPLMTIMQSAARKASRSLVRDFGEVENLQVSRKGPADFVTAADKMAEEVLLDNLRRDRPGYNFLMEEGGEIKGSDQTHRFIVDPLDGTTNFLHGIPHFAISIALERDGELIAGLVYNPVSDEMFHAEKGRGAYLNAGRGGADIKLRAAARTNFNESIFATGIPFLGRPGHGKFLTELHKVMGESAGVRRFGAASLDLCWAAAGRFDGYWERGLAPWDTAAGIVIAREAGLRVEQLGNDSETLADHDPCFSGNIICANETLLPELKKRVN